MPTPDDLGPNVVYERHPGAASALLPPAPASSYRSRQPQDQPLYRIVQTHLETFLAEPLSHGAPPYPRYVEREFRRLLLCGIPAHGFYRVRCPDCGYELPRPWPTPTGVTELIMEPLQFLKRLAVLLPAPYQNLTRYYGLC